MSFFGPLSPVMTIAGAGLLQNTGLGPSATLVSSVSDYLAVPAVAQFTDILDQASTQLGSATFAQLSTLAAGTIPAITDAVPSASVASLDLLAPGGVTNEGLTGLILDTARGIMGDGDISKFTQVFNTAVAYAQQSAIFVSSAINAQKISGAFSSITGGMDNLLTGGFNQVTTSFRDFGSDLARLGDLIDLGNLPNLGDPATLLRQLSSVAGSELPALQQSLDAAGISASALTSLAFGINDIDARSQKNLYIAFTKITGSDLDQVKSALRITIPNIMNMAQLLDPKSIFPDSFSSLTMPTPVGIQPIYINDSINPGLEQYLLDPNSPEYPGDDPVVRIRSGLSPLPGNTI